MEMSTIPLDSHDSTGMGFTMTMELDVETKSEDDWSDEQSLRRLFDVHSFIDSMVKGVEWVVPAGGAVRDALASRPPNDYDVFLIPFVDSSLVTTSWMESTRDRIIEGVSMADIGEIRNGCSGEHIEQFVENQNRDDPFEEFALLKIADIFFEDFPEIQILCNSYAEDPVSLIKGFDTHINQIAFIPESPYFVYPPDVEPEDILQTLKGHRPLRVTNEKNCVESRVREFGDRYGCDISQALRDLEDGQDEYHSVRYFGEPKVESSSDGSDRIRFS